MQNNKISTFKIAATYIGTIVGAGFASGQEVLQFFSVFGIKGLIGLIFTTILFILFGFIIMELGNKLDSTSHIEIVKYSAGKYLGSIIDYIITFFLFGGLTAMIAGSGAMVNQQFNISSMWGTFFMSVLTATTVLSGINGVISSISFVVPFLLASVIGVSLFSIFKFPPNFDTTQYIVSSNSLIRNWLWAAILYTSYNTIVSVAVLGPLGTKALNKKALTNGAILGGLGLGIGSIMIYFAVLGNLESVSNLEIPMVYISGQISHFVQIIYALVLIAEVYTTAVGSLYGFTARIIKISSPKSKYYIIGTTILAFFASNLGFSNLVKYLYPIIGYGGVLLLISLLYTKYKISYKKS